MDSQRCGSLDYRLPVFGVRRDRSYSSLARGDPPIFSRLFVAVAKTGEPAIADAIRSSGNLDRRPIDVDIQFKFLWRRPYAAGRLAVLCLRDIVVSAVYVCDVRLRWHNFCSLPYNLAASHSREFPRQRSIRRYEQLTLTDATNLQFCRGWPHPRIAGATFGQSHFSELGRRFVASKSAEA